MTHTPLFAHSGVMRR